MDDLLLITVVSHWILMQINIKKILKSVSIFYKMGYTGNLQSYYLVTYWYRVPVSNPVEIHLTHQLWLIPFLSKRNLFPLVWWCMIVNVMKEFRHLADRNFISLCQERDYIKHKNEMFKSINQLDILKLPDKIVYHYHHIPRT